ncbi:ECF-type sigma factor [Pseudoalteromonas luteoviolacea]|uniref:ECF-type sigma factor n=1 Tax=Pseudoalteromonas luteoviolacea TaxID=43657 RepID=UPI001F1778C9|nr:ECF-type sigma factor [Pseudoalteromonas luteoviolacea]MCF6442924.1 ECF-type sigma factor [Pseudoalteromonas luteoviolacea]
MDITDLITHWQSGCKKSEKKLKALVYYHLKKVCSSHLKVHKEQIDATFILNNLPNTTCLLHQSLMELLPPSYGIDHKAQLNRYLSLFVRNMLQDEIRKLNAQKRTPPSYSPEEATDASPDQYLALDNALSQLAKQHPTKADIFSQHYFLGLRPEQLAHQLNISTATVYRELKAAKAFIRVNT